MKLGRQISGKPTSLPAITARSTASAMRAPSSVISASASTMADCGTARPISVIAALNRLRSSAVWIASMLAPMSSTPNSASTPASCRPIARLSAV